MALDFLSELSLDQLFNDTLDEVANTAVDTQTYHTYIITNVSKQVLPVIVSNQPNSPFVVSQGLINLQPSTQVLAEQQRYSPAQLQALANMSLIKVTAQAITLQT
jgi:hypothetical protein